MFHATRTRLTMLNAAVFFIILTIFSIIIYMYVSLNLYNKVDASLKERSSQFVKPAELSKRNVHFLEEKPR
ncbi:hypothetical protein M3647_05615 [Paenibacillus cellulositrophicus]|uniref:hypothetical protein n=1 Tax=Paenibacillus cellulositrophicus TaxID=562959 RepID=UPI00203EF86E|nr:hypothetical protein [Paenibacillus cellulositrophicus]MCM2996941.1 hypothetical protein [Paenibacillus cellulositrophicus]